MIEYSKDRKKGDKGKEKLDERIKKKRDWELSDYDVNMDNEEE